VKLWHAPHIVLAMAACGPSAAGTPDLTHDIRVEEVEPLAVDVTFSDVREVAVTTEAIWVLDRHPPFLTSLARAAEPRVLQFGDAGDGPNELRRPVAFYPDEQGVHVWDAQLGKRALFAADGSLQEVERLSRDRSGPIRSNLEQVSHLDPWRIRRVGQAWAYNLLPDGMNHPIEYGRASLVAADRNLASPTSLLELAELVPRDERSQGQFPAMPLWGACLSGLIVWNPRLAQVEWRDVSGSVTRTHPVSSDGVETTLAGIEHFLRAMARVELGPGAQDVDVRSRAEEVREAFGRLGTPFVDVRCDEHGRGWLRSFDLQASPLGDGPSWLVLDPSGPPTQVRFPRSFTPHAFAAGVVIGVVDTERGQALASWKAGLPRPQ